MSKSLCGIDCAKCELHTTCSGCAASDGHPFGEPCMVASCCKQGPDALCQLKQKLMDAFNALGIEDMPQVTDLYALKGSYVNMEFTLPGGQRTKFWNDRRIYLGNQLPKGDSGRCYGLAADETHLMVCEYGPDGEDAALILFKRWA